MYDLDPFAAKKEVQERQTRAADKRVASAVAAAAPKPSPQSREFERCPEVKMAPDLRDLVEDSIKQASNERSSVCLR